jgi:hypothetical protein
VRSRAARSAAEAEAGPARPLAAYAVQTVRISTVDVGRALLCNWAVRGFGPVTIELIFIFSEYIQILANSKKLCRIHLNSENYERNFVE